MKRMSPNAFNLFFLRSWKWSEICQDLILEKEEEEEKESSSEKDQGIEKPDLSKQIDALLFRNFSQIIQKNIFPAPPLPKNSYYLRNERFVQNYI